MSEDSVEHFFECSIQVYHLTSHLVTIMSFKMVLNNCIQHRLLLQEALNVILSRNLQK